MCGHKGVKAVHNGNRLDMLGMLVHRCTLLDISNLLFSLAARRVAAPNA